VLQHYSLLISVENSGLPHGNTLAHFSAAYTKGQVPNHVGCNLKAYVDWNVLRECWLLFYQNINIIATWQSLCPSVTQLSESYRHPKLQSPLRL
jgi:hypothetical protein